MTEHHQAEMQLHCTLTKDEACALAKVLARFGWADAQVASSDDAAQAQLSMAAVVKLRAALTDQLNLNTLTLWSSPAA